MGCRSFPTHWQLLPLAEALDALIDYRGKTPKKTDTGIPLITAKIVKNGKILPVSEFIAEEDYDEWMVRGLPQVGDVVVTTEAPLGEVAQLEDCNVALAQRIVTLRGAKEILESDYLRYVMQGPYVQGQLEARASGSTVKGIKQSELRKVLLPIPPKQEQTKIAKILKSIDNKIQINNQTNQTLEQIAQAIFKSWFVDFEPVKAKINALAAGGSQEDALLAAMQAISGKDKAQLTQLQTENPDYYNQLRTTAELFPAAMHDSELGEIPRGWSASTVGEEFGVTMGQSPPGSTYNEESEGIPFFQGRRDFGKRFPSERVYCTAPKRMANKGDTLLSVRAPVGDSNIALTDCCIGRGLAALRHKSQSSSFTYYSVKQLGKELASYDSEGTVFGSINQKNLKALSVIKPCAQLVGAFESYAGSLDKTIFTKSKESQTLKQTRDTLLPKLLSGELIIKGIRI